ncbi:MAG TPA: glycosyltransferase family 4 protein [Solirubrobacteraceae bacterium]|jgi:phosphatidylinositol alpha-mannosyltransferase
MTSESKLRVGLVYDDTVDRVGGIGVYVMTLGAALIQRGHHVEYLLGRSTQRDIGGAAVHALARNVTVRFNGNQLSMPAFSDARRLQGALDAGRFDVLHVQVPYSPLMAGRLITRADSRCAVVGTYHVASDRMAARYGARALRTLKRRSAPRFDEIISVSAVAARFAARWSGIDAERIVPNLLDVERVRRLAAQGRGSTAAEVVFVGRLVPRKGAAELIDAVAVAGRERGVPLRVSIIGDGPLRGRLERRARRCGIADTTRFHGEVDDVTKLRALARARVACFPSLYGESFGVVILEALAAGCGVVLGGNNPGYVELLADPRAVVDPRDTEAFAARLVALVDNEVLRHSVAIRQRDMPSRFRADVVADEVLRVYESALAARRQHLRLGRPARRHAAA